jgi:polyphosphate glucokinase
MRRAGKSPLTFAIDIGGSYIKASVLDASGRMVASAIGLPTPSPATPPAVLQAIGSMAEQLPVFDRISAGFPGYVGNGRVRTAPNLGTETWRGLALGEVLAERFGKPARVLNDADIHGMGVVHGQGLECVLTLGTGIGFALFEGGCLLPHLELGQHPIRKGRTYDQYLGDAALKCKGPRAWNRRLQRVIATVRALVNCDVLYLGGGNSAVIDCELPKCVKIASNSCGITGGVKLWDHALDRLFSP